MPFFYLGARYGRCLTPRSGRFTPGNDPVPNEKKAGWVPEWVWTGSENLAHNGIQSPDRPARSELLYRLNNPDPHIMII